MKQKLLLTLCLFIGIIGSKAQETYVNRNYQDSSGSPLVNPILNPLGILYSKSLALAGGSVVTVGYTTGSGGGQDILIVKRNDVGVVSFSTTFNTSGSNNDYGTGISQAANGDFLVCGTTDNGGTTNYDIVVLRLSSTGTVLYSATRNATAGKNDVAVDIKELSTGRIVVLANTEATNSFSNFWVLKYGSTLTFSNAITYDYAGYNDFAIGLGNPTSSQITVIGASASSSVSADYVQTVYNTGGMTYSSETRTSLGVGALDKALAFCRDASNNTYITGKSYNGTNFDIKTIKINSSYAIAWTNTLNPYGLDDVGNSVAVDPTNGDVIVGGYATNANSKKEIVCARLASASGALIGTIHSQLAENTSGDVYVAKVCTNNSGDAYFIAGEKGNSGYDQILIGKVKKNGNSSWQRKVAKSFNLLPSDIIVDTEGNIVVVSVKNATLSSYITTSYSELVLDTAKAYYGSSTYKKNEFIVRFISSALSSTVINNQIGTTEREFGKLKDFMTPTAYSTLTTAINSTCHDCDIKVARIFTDMKTTDTIATSNLGESIKLPDFWTALNLVLPANLSVKDAHRLFNQMPSIIAYAHPNFMAFTHSTSNDSLYNKQYSLHTNTVYTNADVNLEQAYSVIPNGGHSGIRCTVLDTRLDWQHKDFGYSGTAASSKIAGGYIWGSNQPLKSIAHGSSSGNNHATGVAGIIGATRNNTVGIAGIAGGNDSIGSKGISIYNSAILTPAGSFTSDPATAPVSYVAQAIKIAAQQSSSTTPFYLKNAYNKAHILNNSWGIFMPPMDTGWYANYTQSNTLIQEAVHAVNRLKTTVVASRGNGPQMGTFITYTTPAYPANCDDDWVMCVSGTGTDGNFTHVGAPFSGVNGDFTGNWGGDIDISAPSTVSLVTSLDCALSTDLSPSIINKYTPFNGTSAAAPHVAGAVGLIMSYLYDSTNAYATYPTPEDCEAIIQLSATDTDTTGYDILTGYGRLNVGKAMKLIEKPTHKLWHFNTKTPFSYAINKTLVSSVDTIRTIEGWYRKNPVGVDTYFPKAKYIVKTYQINSTVYHSIPNADTIISIWPRPSSSVTFPLFTGSGQNKKLVPREKTKIQGYNNSNCALRGYIYQVKDSTGTSVGWWPVDSGFVNTFAYGQWAEYSVLTKNATAIGVKENSNMENNIGLFPNPTNGNLTLEIKTSKVCNISVELYDVMGRKLKTVYSGKSELQKTSINTDVANLPNSLYFYYITVDGFKTTKKFIKQ